jgi:AcrR family transcriptional regulator
MTQRFREIGKADKRERIKASARELFTEVGYEAATVREISSRAGVALGTLSRYAEDKRDLILLVYNDEVEAMIARGAALIRDDLSFNTNLIAFFRVFYESYAANLQLARTYLQVNFFTYGMNTKGLSQNRQRKIDAVKRIVRLGQKRNDVRKDVKPDWIAMQFLFLHSSAVRTWIVEDRPSVRGGLAKMRKLISLQTQGLRPARSR